MVGDSVHGPTAMGASHRRGGQPEATMDEAFACLMSGLLAAEHPRAVLQVDMVGCEHTETCLAVKYANSQVQHTIGQKQTEKCQITDVRMAKLAKDAQRDAAPPLRQAQRRLAQRVGMAPALVSKHAQAMYICVAMHQALERDQTEHNGVIMAARSAGMLHWLPTSNGLRLADGPEWRELTSGSSRIPEAAVDMVCTALASLRPAPGPSSPAPNLLPSLRRRPQQQQQQRQQRQ